MVQSCAGYFIHPPVFFGILISSKKFDDYLQSVLTRKPEQATEVARDKECDTIAVHTKGE
jgi:hypothetical protein